MFCNDTATTEIYTLSLHDALPILRHEHRGEDPERVPGELVAVDRPEGGGDDGDRLRVGVAQAVEARGGHADRKSTRLNSSHANISYAVFCLKEKTLLPRDALILVD